MQLAFDHDLDRPVFISSTHQYSRQGLDNPDALYFHAYIRDDAEYVVRGVRGTTADLSFQVMDGNYGPSAAPGSVAAFDDREIEIAGDGSFEIRFGPAREDAGPNYFALGPGSQTLIVREVYDDWNTEERGQLWIQRVGAEGTPAAPLRRERIAKQYEIAGKLLVGSIKTWFAFPDWFTYKEPVNTLTVPKSTPGGLESQFSSIGHYDLTDEQALVVTVPRCGNDYQAIQVGSAWYVSTDYENHQTSLTVAQSHVDADGLIRYVVSARNPGIANWLETTGHTRGVMMLRWQRLDRALDRRRRAAGRGRRLRRAAREGARARRAARDGRRVRRPDRRPAGGRRPEDAVVTSPHRTARSARTSAGTPNERAGTGPAAGQGGRALRRRAGARPVAGRGLRRPGGPPRAGLPDRAAPREGSGCRTREGSPGARRTHRHHRPGRLPGPRRRDARRSSAGPTC